MQDAMYVVLLELNYHILSRLSTRILELTNASSPSKYHIERIIEMKA